jgi:hypothetical protein
MTHHPLPLRHRFIRSLNQMQTIEAMMMMIAAALKETRADP